MRFNYFLDFSPEIAWRTNGLPSDSTCTTQFSGFFMNSLAMMNTRQATRAKVDSILRLLSYGLFLISGKGVLIMD